MTRPISMVSRNLGPYCSRCELNMSAWNAAASTFMMMRWAANTVAKLSGRVTSRTLAPADWNHAIATDASVGRLEPNNAAVRRRPQGRATGLRAQRGWYDTGCHGGRRATAGTAWRMLDVPGIARG